MFGRGGRSVVKVMEILDAIGKIDDKYILEYEGIQHQEKERKKKPKKYWAVLAACVAVFVLLGIPILKYGSDQNGIYQDTIGHISIHIYDSYTEFEEILPEKSLLQKLDGIAGAKVEYKGVCAGSSSYAPIAITSYRIRYTEEGKRPAIVEQSVRYRFTAEEIAKTQQYESIRTINNTMVYYGYNRSERRTEAAFMYNGHLYQVGSYDFSETTVWKLVEQLLESE